MSDRLFGIETEYAAAPIQPDHADARRQGLLRQLMSRARASWPSVTDACGSGLFFQNGARLYIDCGSHPEMATPEVATPWDVVRYVLAGERMLAQLLAGSENGRTPPLPIALFKTNVDYTAMTTWGCHESIMHTASQEAMARQLIPHLVARIVFTGAGGFNPLSPGAEFMVSPRAAFLEQPVSSSSTFARGIFHTKNESLAAGRYGRLHILCGESLCSETAMWLRTATTVLVAAMVEGGLRPADGLALEDSPAAMRAFATDPDCCATVPVSGGLRLSALDIERRYLELAEAHVGADFMPPWADTACRHWRSILDNLSSRTPAIGTTLDWAIKRAVFGQHAASRGFGWDDLAVWTRIVTVLASRHQMREPPAADASVPPSVAYRDHRRAVQTLLDEHRLSWEAIDAFVRLRHELFEADVRFGQIGGPSIFASLDRGGALTHAFPGVEAVADAIEHPPAVGRARIRGQVIRRAAGDPGRYRCYWHYVVDTRERLHLDLSNPLETVERWAACQDPEVVPRVADTDASSIDLRGEAYGFYLIGDFEQAERLLCRLLARRFDVAGTHCHLARVLLMADRSDEARIQIAQAWAERDGAPPYVVARTLWFQALLAAMDGGDLAPFLGRIKVLMVSGEVSSDWTMEPLLEHVEPHVPRAQHALLAALAAALSDRQQAGRLDSMPEWVGCQEVAVA